jgi:hypothetical protein
MYLSTNHKPTNIVTDSLISELLLYCSLAPSLPTQPKISPLSAWSNHQVFRSKKIPFAHSLAASSFLITPVHVELHQKIKMDNCRAASKDQDGQLEGLCPTDKLVIGEKQSYSSSSSSSAQSAMTTASKREWEDNNNVDDDDNDGGLNDNNFYV